MEGRHEHVNCPRVFVVEGPILVLIKKTLFLMRFGIVIHLCNKKIGGWGIEIRFVVHVSNIS